jgi:glutathione S-transferase
MLRLYGSANSRAVRAIWMLGELGIPYEHKDWLPRCPETKTPEFRALNSNGRVPTIDDDGFVLAESMAINLYLARKHKSPLYPSDPQGEALAIQWSLWETDRLDRQIVDYVRHLKALPAAERKPEIAEKAWKEVVPAFDVLENALGKSKYLLGNEFSVADLNVAAALFRALSIDLAQWPKLDAWMKACWARPAAAKARALRDK